MSTGCGRRLPACSMPSPQRPGECFPPVKDSANEGRRPRKFERSDWKRAKREGLHPGRVQAEAEDLGRRRCFFSR